jgi:hypothetical protein
MVGAVELLPAPLSANDRPDWHFSNVYPIISMYNKDIKLAPGADGQWDWGAQLSEVLCERPG